MIVMGQYKAVAIGTWWYLVNRRRYWSIHDGTGSVHIGTGLYMMVLGQYGSILVGTWWYWIRRGRYWLVLGGTGLVEGSTR